MLRGYLGPVSGQISGLKISKVGVIQVDDDVEKKKPKKIKS